MSLNIEKIHNYKNLKFWCYKVLPLVYDNSLSYYEVLCKITKYINNLIEDVKTCGDNIEAMYEAFEQLQEYVDNYFDDLNIQQIVTEIITPWLNENVPELVEDWVEENAADEIDDWLDTNGDDWINTWLNTNGDTIIGQWLTGNLHIPFYNVEDYGIHPNMDVQVYNYLHDLMANHVAQTGGVVYFPSGKYTIDYTIFIPSNTILLGDGYSSEIYFNESNTTIGVGLMNGGSNVAIKNIRISQASRGTFSSGAQPGCIGFSDTTIDNVFEGKYSHTVHRGDVKNLIVENVFFDGNYAVQTENSASNKIENVTYRNLWCPASCVSVAPWNEINNVMIENVDCDLLRIWDNHKILSRTGVKNLTCINTRANTLYVSDYHGIDDTGFTFINFEQKTATKQNNVLSATYADVISCNAKFDNCKFYARTTETDGIGLWYGQLEFNKCVFDMYSHIVYPNISVTNNESYALYMNDCVISNRANSPAITVLMGYGSNNTINGTNILRRLFGDMNDYYPLFENVSPTAHPNRLILNNKTLRLSIYSTISSVISSYPARLSQFPCDFSLVPCTVWNSSNRSGTEVNTFLNISSGNIVIGDSSLSASNYDRIMIHTNLDITRTPTVKEIHTLLA